MLKLLVKALGLIAGLILSGAVSAVSLGGINVTTALGEPLKAEIELVAVGKADKNGLVARMASPDVFKGAGMDYPVTLPTLKFKLETRPSGEPYLKLTSAQPVNDPFVSILVELSWSSGRLLREYTFLLDPPGFQPEQPKAPEVKPVLSKVEGTTEADAPAATPEPVAEAVAVKSEPMPMPTTVQTTTADGVKTGESGNVAAGVIRVKRGDTLNKIAREQPMPPDVSLERMLVALYRANTDAFDGNNMNRLRVGKILRAPENSDLNNLAQADAVMEIRAQAADWHAYRQQLAAASGSAMRQAPSQEASGKISTTISDKAPAAKESATEVVRLSKGEAPGDKAVAAGNAKALQDKVHALEEEAVVRSKALKDSNDRIAMLEKNIKDMQRLIELKMQQPGVQAKPESKPEPAKVEAAQPTAPVTAPVVAAESAVASASAAKPAKPARKPAAAPKEESPPPSMLDEILAEPLYLAGGAVVVLGLGGLGLMLARRGRTGKGSKGTDTGARISAPIAPSPETGDFTQTPVAGPAALALSSDVDPISEADLFLNFGRDQQAEEILKDALQKDPANQQIRLKLLSIYANRKDVKSFAAIALQVQNSSDAAAWAQAAEMGRKLEPGNPMYGGDDSAVAAGETEEAPAQSAVADLDFDLGFGEPEGAAAGDENAIKLDMPLETEAAATSVDFDLDFGAEEETAPAGESHDITGTLTALQGEKAELDFDLGSDMAEEATSEGTAEGESLAEEKSNAEQEALLDFDITSTHAILSEPEQAGAPAPNPEEMVFDITAPHPSTEAVAEEKPDAEDALTFTLDIPDTDNSGEASPQVAAKELEAVDLGDIDLNLDETAPANATEAKSALWQDVATKLDLARAYQEMGDEAGAREILDEVMLEGDEQQRATAGEMLQQLSV